MSFFKYSCLIIIIILLIGGFLLFRFGDPVFGKLFTPVSIVSKVIGEDNLKSTDGRTNILLLGMDKRSPDSHSAATGVLTDTIIVVSVGKKGNNTVMISIPRDLYVRDIDEKINALYARNCNVYNCGKYSGGSYNVDRVRSEVESILGMPIHYYALVGFEAFTDAIEAVGGVQVDVENSFVDYAYPIEGMENAEPESARYKTIRFNKGIQTMNGETALEFSRSRHAENYIEAGDFARARRQQKIILALKDKVLSSSTLLNPAKISELYKAFEKNVETDITLPEALLFYSKAEDVEISNIKKIVLSDEGLDEQRPGTGMLFVPNQELRESRYGGKYVLIPKDESYDEIKALVRQYLFCDSTQENCN